jgi:phosphoribosyl 1,2-cyclic phosphodiesterase
VKLTFLGTRGNIDVRSRRHQRHTSTLVSLSKNRVMIDCGADWLGRLQRAKPGAILLTHAHPDHVDGLRQGAPCTVYAMAEVWQRIRNWPLSERTILRPHEPVTFGSLEFEPVPVHHSLRAPAVGYRISSGKTMVFYVPDVLDILDRDRVFAGVTLYIGDGASIRRSIQRRQNGTRVGHASVETQVGWCADAGIPRAIFTHCGTGIVAHGVEAEGTVVALAQARGLVAQVAYDGLQVALH